VHSLDRLLERLGRPIDNTTPDQDPGPSPIVVTFGDDSLTASAGVARRWLAGHPGAHVIQGPDAATLPFTTGITVPPEPSIIWIPDLHEAFVNRQGSGTRLVTTQAAYQLLSWLQQVKSRDVLLLTTADRTSLEEHAPELLSRRAGLGRVTLHDASVGIAHEASSEVPSAADSRAPSAAAILADAFRRNDAGERLALCVEALGHGRTPPVLVAAASVCMEVNDLDAATRDLEEAASLAPHWPAVHFERGKLWLRRDDMEQASRAFLAAAEGLPSFGPAWANLGATLGELDRPTEALAAFERALACDPLSHQTLNNIGVVKRELGQLAESEGAFRQVIALAPTLAFGHYNLGHTLFLQGRYQAALSAYVEGQKRDPERNPVQASRLSLSRLASGDPDGALSELRRAIPPLPADYRRQLLVDTSSILMALLTHRPDLAGWDRVNAWVSMELGKLPRKHGSE
jgi:tetratricopeptide (TPR) repeat protein